MIKTYPAYNAECYLRDRKCRVKEAKKCPKKGTQRKRRDRV